RAGRFFTGEDRADGRPVVIVSESFARRQWPGVQALGKRIKLFGPDDGEPWATVVGVVGDVRYRGLGLASLDYYVPFTQSPFAPSQIVLRTEGEPAGLAAALER
ncbi:MAG TPA: hypothetical protein DD490_33810, partial [Acidobacteria bacterium]|nr:hypothetical protein [Acidobacteriota bacterium]